ncbi:DEDDh family exonuclease [Streptomyces sp. A244]|uniref:DEDDh family exonuclease n=1 Tax=Streptomyces sp. A244 TaxID=2137016 RepID=UPI000D1B74BA|nr:DEDDh family exonuclease [Streptomyces sp. A244]PTH84013.1 DEDDh family exonuclease [Streptomyces sp. A244]
MSLLSPAFDDPGLRDYAHDWAVLDVETSGLVARRDRVLSVAVVVLGPDGEQTEEFSTLLDPGCDPGPVHVHGLTAERLRGAPVFDQVAPRIAGMLRDRVLVAHNAQFDYDFLAHEFARAGAALPVARRLCTLALNRRVDPPTEDLRLGTLAAHYGVPQVRAHDALDDTRVLAGVLRASLREAARLELPLPFVSCPPRQDPRFAPRTPKAPCAYRNPGRPEPGGPLVQGMKVAITGETLTPRAELERQAVQAGLNVMASVSRHTSALVTNDASSGSGKARRALAEGVPVLDESTFVRLLGDVRPGTPHERTRSPEATVPSPATPPAPARIPQPVEEPAPPAAVLPGPASSAPSAPSAPPRPAHPAAQDRPLSGRRVLVLGGTHPDAVAARGRIVELGGAAAINLSSSVTDVVLLEGGERDRRMKRITALAFPTHEAAWLDAPVITPLAHQGGGPAAPRVLPRGGVIDLPQPSGSAAAAPWTVTAAWAQQTSCEIDVVAFVVDEDEQVCFDEDFVFYGAPENPGGTVRLHSDGPTEQTIGVDLAALPPSARKVVVAAAIDGSPTFGDVGAIHISSGPGPSAAPLVQATLDAATTERTLLLAELYRRGPLWRLRTVGQGYDRGLGALARSYGVDVAG